MNILELLHSFKAQEQALEYLEAVRWKGQPKCPYCHEETVCRHASGDRKNQRWQRWSCKRAFSVSVGTIFYGTHIPLQNWSLVLGLMLKAKKSASACQIARDLGMRRPTVWNTMHCIRTAKANDPEQGRLLYGIVGTDETYAHGKPRKGNDKRPKDGSERGRGTSEAGVIGRAEHGGRVIAKMAEKGEISNKGLARFVTRFVDTSGSVLMTDEFSGYDVLAGPSSA